METVYSSKALLTTSQTTRCRISENHNMNLHHRENMKFCIVMIILKGS